MTKKTRFSLIGLFCAAAVGVVYAIGLSGLIINEPGLTYSKRYTYNLANLNVNTVSATATYSSATFTSATFTTGQTSTGTLTVIDNTKLSTASATEAITVTSTSGAAGDSIVVTNLLKPGAYVFIAGRDWRYGATTALTAASIKRVLDTVPYFATSRAGAVLYSTSTTAGSNANAILVQTNSPTTISISSPSFLGGRDATVIGVNGYNFKAVKDFAIGADAGASATNLYNAINARAGLSSQVTAAIDTDSVTLVSNKAGTIYNFSLTSSNHAAVTTVHPTMIGATNPSQEHHHRGARLHDRTEAAVHEGRVAGHRRTDDRHDLLRCADRREHRPAGHQFGAGGPGRGDRPD